MPATDAAWLADDLAHGLPRLDESQREAWTPQMLSLERLHAFSLKKGCYPGQEIVARTHYLGQAKRALAQNRRHRACPRAGTSRRRSQAGQRSSAPRRTAGMALAVLPAGLDPETVLATDAGHCRLRPLFNGLAPSALNAGPRQSRQQWPNRATSAIKAIEASIEGTSMKVIHRLATALLSLTALAPAFAADYYVTVEPNYPPAQAQEVYKPLMLATCPRPPGTPSGSRLRRTTTCTGATCARA